MAVRKIKCMVFDFDGTLAKLTLDFNYMRNEVAKLAGKYFPSTPEHNGRPVLEWIDELAEVLQNGPGLNGFRDRAVALVEDIEVKAAQKGRVFSFTNPMLTGLSRGGVKTAVITRNCRAAVDAVHPKLEKMTSAILTRNDVARVKPDPEHLLAALRQMGVDPEQAIMVGDHPMDILTGKRAGTMTAGVLTGSGDWSALLSSKADFVVRDAKALVNMLAFERRFGT